MNVLQLEQYLLRVATVHGSQKKASSSLSPPPQQHTAHVLLKDPQTTATGCFKAAHTVLGPTFRAWEPETVWLTLDRQGVALPLLNRDKLLAAVTLTIVPAFWWELNAFENTTMAFNNVLSDSDTLQEATPAQLSWAVYEAELLYGQSDVTEGIPEFDHEPVSYTALVLHRAGFILAPDLLQFSQTALDKLNKDGTLVTKEAIAKAWKTFRKKDLQNVTFSETDPLDIQLKRLTEVQLYVLERLNQYDTDLSQLSGDAVAL